MDAKALQIENKRLKRMFDQSQLELGQSRHLLASITSNLEQAKAQHDAVTEQFTLTLEEKDRKKLGLPDLEGLPGMSLRPIIARKSPPEGPNTIQLEVEFSGFISVPVIEPPALINLDN